MTLKVVIFDMDGTITKPYIDWKSLRDEIGIPQNEIIIDYIESLPFQERKRANRILEMLEGEAAQNSEINEGAEELLQFLKEKGIKTALVTNNNRRAMEHVLERHSLDFDILLSREDGSVKPSEELILRALDRTGAEKDQAIAVGDGRFDLEASKKAGVRCIYLSNSTPALEHNFTAHTLHDVVEIIDKLTEA